MGMSQSDEPISLYVVREDLSLGAGTSVVRMCRTTGVKQGCAQSSFWYLFWDIFIATDKGVLAV